MLGMWQMSHKQYLLITLSTVAHKSVAVEPAPKIPQVLQVLVKPFKKPLKILPHVKKN